MSSKLVPDDIRKQIKLLWAKGFSAGVIAQKTGRTRSSVMGLVSRMKLPSRTTDIAHPRYNWPDGKNPSYPKSQNKEKPLTALSGEPEAIGPLNTFPDTASCKWIAGDVLAGDWRCCGHKIQAYNLCAFHRPIGRVKPATRAR